MDIKQMLNDTVDQQNHARWTGGLYAMKTLKKNQVLAKNQVAHVWSEKDILSEADNDWIVKLYYSFQVKCFYGWFHSLNSDYCIIQYVDFRVKIVQTVFIGPLQDFFIHSN